MELEEQLASCTKLERNPNRNLSPWGANDINQLVHQTKIQHPEEPKVNGTPNAWKKPPRLRRTPATHSYDEVKNNITPQKRNTNNSTAKNNTAEKNQHLEDNIDGQALLNELKKMKAEIIAHCSNMFDRELKKIKKEQEEQKKVIKVMRIKKSKITN